MLAWKPEKMGTMQLSLPKSLQIQQYGALTWISHPPSNGEAFLERGVVQSSLHTDTKFR